MICNVVINCYDFLASVIDGGTTMEYWWNDNDNGKPKQKVKQSCYRPGVAQRFPGS